MTRKSTAAVRSAPEHTPIDSIRQIIAAGVQLDTEAAMEVWIDLNKSRHNFHNEGKLLTELLTLAPVNFDHTELRHRGCDPRNLACAILQHIAREGLSFEGVCEHMPSLAISSREEYKIPVEVVRPLLAEETDDEQFFSILKRDPELYAPEFDGRILKTFREFKNHYGYEEYRLFVLKCEAFWGARRADVIPLLFDSTRIDSTDNFLAAFSKLLKDTEKEQIIEATLKSLKGGPYTPNGHDTVGRDFLQKIYMVAKKRLSSESRTKLIEAFKAKIDEFMKVQETRDPVEAFLDGEIPWEEVAFAKAQPEAYQKWIATRSKDAEDRRKAYREFGPWGMMMTEGSPYGRRWPHG